MRTELKLFRDDGELLLVLVGMPRVRWEAAQPDCVIIEPGGENIESIEILINDCKKEANDRIAPLNIVWKTNF